MNICQNPKCGKEITNPKYCSRACVATVNNVLFPKRNKKLNTCKICGKEVSGRKTLCDDHNSNNIDWSNITYEQVTGARSYQKNSRIRDLARRKYCSSGKPQKCIVCGYDRHFRVCHKKAIHSFTSDTPILVINDIDNLIALCPNHHWEFDNDTLTF